METMEYFMNLTVDIYKGLAVDRLKHDKFTILKVSLYCDYENNSVSYTIKVLLTANQKTKIIRYKKQL